MKNFFLSVIIGLFFLIFIVKFSLAKLNDYTMHESFIVVPNLIGIRVEDISDTISKLNLRYLIIDSGAYNPNYPRGSVLSQLPKQFSKVKSNRKLLLTINPSKVSLISIPDFTDKSKRQYISELSAKGFRIGKLIYVNDIHSNVVLGVNIDDKIIDSNTKIEKSSIVDLTLGNGNNQKINTPNLKGLKFINIKSQLFDESLNIGELIFDKSVVDTFKSFVFKQFPSEDSINIDLGTKINLWFTEDSINLVTDSSIIIN